MHAIHARRIVMALALLSMLVVTARLAMSHEEHAEKDAAAGGGAIAKVFDQELPPGDFRKATAITVSYGPGGTTPKHRHDVAVFAYVWKGNREPTGRRRTENLSRRRDLVRTARHGPCREPQCQPDETRQTAGVPRRRAGEGRDHVCEVAAPPWD